MFNFDDILDREGTEGKEGKEAREERERGSISFPVLVFSSCVLGVEGWFELIACVCWCEA